MSNEHLLDDLFEDKSSDHDSQSSDDDQLVEWADTVLASAQSNNSFRDRWLTNEKKLSLYYDSSREKLILYKNNCYFDYEGNGEFQFTGATRDMVELTTSMTESPLMDSSPPPVVWITSIPRTFLTLQPPQIENLSPFFLKYNFEETFVRHICKLDRLLVSYIVSRFDPQRSKPRNAFSNYCDSLNSKFPQPWRRKSFLAIPEIERGDCETKPLINFLNFGSSEVDDFEIENFSGGQFLFLGSDLYVMLESDSPNVTVLVDGFRCVAREGPVGPLQDGSVVMISTNSTEFVPEHLFLIECAKNETELIDRRNKIAS